MLDNACYVNLRGRGAVVGIGPGTDCEAMCAALLVLSVQARDAAACITTRRKTSAAPRRSGFVAQANG
jgi:ribose 5-phosphate isomerase